MSFLLIHFQVQSTFQSYLKQQSDVHTAHHHAINVREPGSLDTRNRRLTLQAQNWPGPEHSLSPDCPSCPPTGSGQQSFAKNGSIEPLQSPGNILHPGTGTIPRSCPNSLGSLETKAHLTMTTTSGWPPLGRALRWKVELSLEKAWNRTQGQIGLSNSAQN